MPVVPVNRLLESFKFRHLSAALRWCGRHSPAAAVVECDSTPEEGIRFVRALRERGFSKPIFLISSRVDVIAQRCKGLAIAGIYEKPLDATVMGNDIYRKIAAHQALQSLRAGSADPKMLPTPDRPKARPGAASTLEPGAGPASRPGRKKRIPSGGPYAAAGSEHQIRAVALASAAAMLLALLSVMHRPTNTPVSSRTVERPSPLPKAVGSLEGGGHQALDGALGSRNQTSLVVLDGRGRVLYSRLPDDALRPASTLKLFVAASAYATLGPNFHFTTTLGSEGAPRGGVLAGDLVLSGDGDPTLRSNDLEKAARFVGGRIRRIKGSLDVLTAPFLPPEQNADWSADDLKYSYAAGSSAVALDENVAGGVPVHNIPLFVANVFGKELRRAGIEIRNTRTGKSAPERWIGWRHRSPALRQIVTQMLSESNNMYAEQLLRKVGQRRYGVATTRAGVDAEFEMLRRLGVPTQGLEIRDGSGLAPADRASATVLASFLQSVQRAPWGALLYQSIPLAGKQGTIAARSLSAARARVRAKDGHLQNSNSLAGYVDTRHHGRLSFAFIANASNIPRKDFETMQDKVMDVLANY